MILTELMSGVTFRELDWMWEKLRQWLSPGHTQCIPTHPILTLDGTVLKESVDFDIFGVTFEAKIFETHLWSLSWAASQRLGMLRKLWEVFHKQSLLVRCFLGFVLPVFQHCSAVWCLATDTLLKPLVTSLWTDGEHPLSPSVAIAIFLI